jgi:hypothetical protein
MNEGLIGTLLNLNNIGSNLVVHTKNVIQNPIHNEQKHTHVYVTSILVVAEKAAVEGKFYYSGYFSCSTVPG